MDCATALVLVGATYTLPEFGMSFFEKRVGLSIEYVYFYGSLSFPFFVSKTTNLTRIFFEHQR